MTKITVQTEVYAPVEKVWELFNAPEHIVKWGSTSDDWHTVRADNDLRVGGEYSYRMEARDGSAGFDLTATYTEVVSQEFIAYTMVDGRKVEIAFRNDEGKTHITQTFDAENENTIDKQRGGWQAILDNFKSYVETLEKK